MQVPFVDLKSQYSKIRDEIRSAMDRVLDSQQFILGKEVAALEEEIASFCGTRFAIGCNSGTDALLLSLLAVGVQPGDEVITSSYSFFSTAGMIAWMKAIPIFVDINPDTFLLPMDQVRKKITKRTCAIITVDLFGQCCAVEELQEMEIPVIEDAAQAIGASRNERAAGSLGATGCFSFFPTKNLAAYGDGGMITTNSEEICAQIRKLRSHGEGNQKYRHELVGTNSRLDELQAAVLRVKLKHLNEWNERRAQNATYYLNQLQGLPLQLPKTETGNRHTFHQFVIRTEARDQLKIELERNGIGSAIYYPVPLPLQPCFEKLRSSATDYPGAVQAASQSLAIPVHAELSENQLQFVVKAIHNFFNK